MFQEKWVLLTSTGFSDEELVSEWLNEALGSNSAVEDYSDEGEIDYITEELIPDEQGNLSRQKDVSNQSDSESSSNEGLDKSSPQNINAEDVHFKVDTSASSAPRGFPDFDKLQLDATRREHVETLKVKMIDANEEYLAKHPQVEALIRLILIEVLCHKPYDVRKFIKDLLMQDNIETRVAKIMLSKRINLERAHTTEYFGHVADWETKCISKNDRVLPTPEWPEPRPYRTEKRRDKVEYCHLHYFKEPFILYPTELAKLKDSNNENNEASIFKLPKWKSTFLLKDFVRKWGDPLNEDPKDEGNQSPKSDKDFFSEQKSSKIDQDEEEDDGISERKERENGDGSSSISDATENHRRLLITCPICRKAVLGLHKSIDDVELLRSTMEKESGSTLKPLESSFQLKKTSRSLKAGPTLCDFVDMLDRSWAKSNKLQVYSRTRGKRKYLYNEKMERLATVKTRAKGTHMVHNMGDYVPTWTISPNGEEIEFAVPIKELHKKRIAESGIELQSQVSGSDKSKNIHTEKQIERWSLPRKYRHPNYQVVIKPSKEEPVEMATLENVKIVNLEGEIIRMQNIDISEQILVESISSNEAFSGGMMNVPVVNLEGEVIKKIPVNIDGDEIVDRSGSIVSQKREKSSRSSVVGRRSLRRRNTSESFESTNSNRYGEKSSQSSVAGRRSLRRRNTSERRKTSESFEREPIVTIKMDSEALSDTDPRRPSILKTSVESDGIVKEQLQVLVKDLKGNILRESDVEIINTLASDLLYNEQKKIVRIEGCVIRKSSSKECDVIVQKQEQKKDVAQDLPLNRRSNLEEEAKITTGTISYREAREQDLVSSSSDIEWDDSLSEE